MAGDARYLVYTYYFTTMRRDPFVWSDGLPPNIKQRADDRGGGSSDTLPPRLGGCQRPVELSPSLGDPGSRGRVRALPYRDPGFDLSQG